MNVKYNFPLFYFTFFKKILVKLGNTKILQTSQTHNQCLARQTKGAKK